MSSKNELSNKEMSTQKYNLEAVYKLSGVPNITFVKPREYAKILISLRTPGRGLIIQGPSGIGKSTAVSKAIEELQISTNVRKLSARKQIDVQEIRKLPRGRDEGVVIIDDFHKLPKLLQGEIADFLKTLADEEREDTKLVVVGINNVGESLVASASDLASRIEIVSFGRNPDESVDLLLSMGENALNMRLGIRDEIVKAANGSFYLAQILAHEACIHAGVTETSSALRDLNVSFEHINYIVQQKLGLRFTNAAITFATGIKLHKIGRASYLYILKWLADSQNGAIDLDREMTKYPNHLNSVRQIVNNGNIVSVLQKDPEFGTILHYDEVRHVLAAEDPQFIYFLRNLSWDEFAQQVGYLNVNFPTEYDIALSFAGEMRALAKGLFDKFSENDLAVFYDRNEQHRILAANMEEYLGPIYRTKARIIVVLLSGDYPSKVWTQFESEQFKSRLKDGEVIPVKCKGSPLLVPSEMQKIGSLTFDPGMDLNIQVQQIAESIINHISERFFGGPF